MNNQERLSIVQSFLIKSQETEFQDFYKTNGYEVISGLYQNFNLDGTEMSIMHKVIDIYNSDGVRSNHLGLLKMKEALKRKILFLPGPIFNFLTYQKICLKKLEEYGIKVDSSKELLTMTIEEPIRVEERSFIVTSIEKERVLPSEKAPKLVSKEDKKIMENSVIIRYHINGVYTGDGIYMPDDYDIKDKTGKAEYILNADSVFYITGISAIERNGQLIPVLDAYLIPRQLLVSEQREVVDNHSRKLTIINK